MELSIVGDLKSGFRMDQEHKLEMISNFQAILLKDYVMDEATYKIRKMAMHMMEIGVKDNG